MAESPADEVSRRHAEIVDPHLPEGFAATPDVLTYLDPDDDGTTPSPLAEDTPAQSSLRLQGGDVHRDLFKIKARAAKPRRSASFCAHSSPRLQPAWQPAIPEQLEPGGLRRQFLKRQQTVYQATTYIQNPVTSNFISFLELYGSFAGEDLADTDRETESAISDDEESGLLGERRPLLGRRKPPRKPKHSGDAGTTKTFFTLLKAFIGTGIMFLPKAFRNGGILFSSVTLITVSIVTTVCFRLLLHCRKKYQLGGYGELGEAICGPRFRSVILASITLSQLGFVCAGIIFTAQNLLAFLNAVTFEYGSAQPFNTNALIAVQFVVLIPMALIRNISKLGPAALIADVFILIGLVYIWQYDIAALSTRGAAPSMTLFNPSDFTLTIGSAIFTFEGIGLILPIQSSMREPHKFSYLLYAVMFIITAIFTSVGALCYATFGDETKIQIISNFPQDSKLVNVVQFLYSLAVLVGEPVQLFPAVRIIETSLLGEKATGKRSAAVKWKKNAVRSAAIVTCGLVAVVGASDLDKFVALIGAFACVPLVYIYPPYLHFKAVASTSQEKAFDVALISVGVVACVYSTVMVVFQWITP